MPTVSSIGNRKLAMFATRHEIDQAAPILRQPKYRSLALEHYFHSGYLLKRIASRVSLPREAVALLDINFAFGAMLFRDRSEMMDWLIQQSGSNEREILP